MEQNYVPHKDRPDRHKIIHEMNRGIWDEEILSEEFMFSVEKVLTKKERITAEMRIEGYSNKEIAKLMKCDPSRVRHRIMSIKKKFENLCSTRINPMSFDDPSGVTNSSDEDTFPIENDVE